MFFFPSSAGKTTWVASLLRNAETLIDAPFDYIVWFYGEPNSILKALEDEFQGKLIAVHGLPDNIDEYIDKTKRGLHIYDDLMIQATSSKQISEICAIKSHHCSLSWIILLQNLFHSGKERLNFYRCAHYLVLFNTILDRSQIYTLAHKIMPRHQHLFIKLFEIAADRPFGYLFIDARQSTPADARYRTDIFQGYQKVFIPQI